MKVLDIGIGVLCESYPPEPTILKKSMWELGEKQQPNPHFTFGGPDDAYIAVEFGETVEQCPYFESYGLRDSSQSLRGRPNHAGKEVVDGRNTTRGIAKMSDYFDKIKAQRVGEKIELIAADARRLPMPDNLFDVVYMGNVLNEDKTPEASMDLIKEARRVLRVGGLFISKISYTPHTYPNERAHDEASSAGFAEVEIARYLKESEWYLEIDDVYGRTMHDAKETLGIFTGMYYLLASK
jgi:SAM-dependent methyltransferase